MSISYRFTTLDNPLATLATVPYDVNDKGQVVGSYTGGPSFIDYSFYYQAEQYTIIQNYTVDINNLDQLLVSNNGVTLIVSNGLVISVEHPAGTIISGMGFNDKGDVVGSYQALLSNGFYGSPHPFLASNGHFVALAGLPNAIYGEATGVNNNGDVVGWYYDGTIEAGFVFSQGIYTTLIDPLAPSIGPAASTHATGINDVGQIVGYFLDDSFTAHSFIYFNGKYTTVDDPLADGQAGTIAQGISNQGQIVGYYTNGTIQVGGFLVEKSHGFITTPVNLIATATQLHDLTPAEIHQLASQGISYFFSTTPATDVELTVAQIKVLEANDIKVSVPSGAQIELSDSISNMLDFLGGASFKFADVIQNLHNLENMGVSDLAVQIDPNHGCESLVSVNDLLTLFEPTVGQELFGSHLLGLLHDRSFDYLSALFGGAVSGHQCAGRDFPGLRGDGLFEFTHDNEGQYLGRVGSNNPGIQVDQRHPSAVDYPEATLPVHLEFQHLGSMPDRALGWDVAQLLL